MPPNLGQAHQLPKWSSIRALTRKQSALYQGFARELTADRGYSRMHLNVVIWGER